jgi:hypothetical protein
VWEPNGRPGELVDRLMNIVRTEVGPEGSWFDLGMVMALALGGQPIRVIPDIRRLPEPGSLGEAVRASTPVVSQNVYFEMIRLRMVELIDQGVNEAFIVHALRDQLRRDLMRVADVGVSDQRRAELREWLEATMNDPEGIAAVRASMAEEDPSVATLPAEEIEARLTALADSPVLTTTPLERAVDSWAAVERWDREVASQLSDETIDDWNRGFLHRMTQ